MSGALTSFAKELVAMQTSFKRSLKMDRNPDAAFRDCILLEPCMIIHRQRQGPKM